MVYGGMIFSNRVPQLCKILKKCEGFSAKIAKKGIDDHLILTWNNTNTAVSPGESGAARCGISANHKALQSHEFWRKKCRTLGQIAGRLDGPVVRMYASFARLQTCSNQAVTGKLTQH